MTTWDAFVSRRQLQIHSFLTYHKITDKKRLVEYLTGIGVAQPCEAVIESMFPKLEAVVSVSLQKSVIENDVLITPEVCIDNDKETKIEQGESEESLVTSRSNLRPKVRNS